MYCRVTTIHKRQTDRHRETERNTDGGTLTSHTPTLMRFLHITVDLKTGRGRSLNSEWQRICNAHTQLQKSRFGSNSGTSPERYRDYSGPKRHRSVTLIFKNATDSYTGGWNLFTKLGCNWRWRHLWPKSRSAIAHCARKFSPKYINARMVAQNIKTGRMLNRITVGY